MTMQHKFSTTNGENRANEAQGHCGTNEKSFESERFIITHRPRMILGHPQSEERGYQSARNQDASRGAMPAAVPIAATRNELERA